MSKKRQRTSDQPVNKLLNYFKDRSEEFEDIRHYYCPIYEDDFYFVRASMLVEKTINNEKDFPSGAENLMARYWALACDEHGNRHCQPHRLALIEAVKNSMGDRGFRDHCGTALVAVNEIATEHDLFADDKRDSDQEGTLEYEKKDSSSTPESGTQ